MSQNTSLVGQIDLLSLLGASYLNVNGKDSVVIPTEDNPSIFVSLGKDGNPKAYLDIVVRQTPNSQWGNSHMIKASVGKTNRERLGLSKDDMGRYSPILGNLRQFESRETSQPEGGHATEGFKGF